MTLGIHFFILDFSLEVFDIANKVDSVIVTVKAVNRDGRISALSQPLLATKHTRKYFYELSNAKFKFVVIPDRTSLQALGQGFSTGSKFTPWG